MSQKLVAYAVVFIIAFVVCLRLLEASNLVAVSVDTQVSAGQIEVEFAPRLARMLELAAAAVVSLFITTGRLGDLAAAGLIRLWNVLRSRLSRTIAGDSPSVDNSLDEVLTEHDIRISNVEKVLGQASPLDRAIDGRVETIDQRLAKVEGVLAELQSKHNGLVDRTNRHKADIAELRTRVESIESEPRTAPAARARSTRKKEGA